MTQYLADMHVHSDNSPDGNDSVSYICEQAIENGLSAVTITDHCETESFVSDSVSRNLRQSAFEVKKAANVFDGQLDIYFGVELGQANHDPASAAQALQVCNFDFIIGSLHNLRDKEDFYYLDYSKEDIDALLLQYFNELLELATVNMFDVLGHLTYPLRYIIDRTGKKPDLQKYNSILDEIFKTVIKNGKGIEINVSSLRHGMGETMPDAGIIKRYRDAGGEIITVGSDAHNARDVGIYIPEGIKVARDAGFEHVCLFEKHRPVSIPIPV